MSHHTNIVRIKAVHSALAQLGQDVVFVGGATISLYADRVAPEIRPTEDIDVLIELWAYKDFAAVEEQLRRIGFIHDNQSRVICRYKWRSCSSQAEYEGEEDDSDILTVDIMATGENVLGFGNKWYPEGFERAINYSIDQEHTIKIFTAPYFIAAKLEAFKSPSRDFNNDGFHSTDFEDIVFVLENRLAVWKELREAPDTVKSYLQEEFKKLLENPRMEEWVDAHAGWGSPPANYYILDELEKFALKTAEEQTGNL